MHGRYHGGRAAHADGHLQAPLQAVHGLSTATEKQDWAFEPSPIYTARHIRWHQSQAAQRNRRPCRIRPQPHDCCGMQAEDKRPTMSKTPPCTCGEDSRRRRRCLRQKMKGRQRQEDTHASSAAARCRPPSIAGDAGEFRFRLTHCLTARQPCGPTSAKEASAPLTIMQLERLSQPGQFRQDGSSLGRGVRPDRCGAQHLPELLVRDCTVAVRVGRLELRVRGDAVDCLLDLALRQAAVSVRVEPPEGRAASCLRKVHLAAQHDSQEVGVLQVTAVQLVDLPEERPEALHATWAVPTRRRGAELAGNDPPVPVGIDGLKGRAHPCELVMLQVVRHEPERRLRQLTQATKDAQIPHDVPGVDARHRSWRPGAGDPAARQDLANVRAPGGRLLTQVGDEVLNLAG
mmetsp:Transcript_98687/g.284754  ORF Transcript_98687/g.284754 Transcript_98687/m.284754 type:complete len:403 (-) Transcript_98687:782-1990(-)